MCVEHLGNIKAEIWKQENIKSEYFTTVFRSMVYISHC